MNNQETKLRQIIVSQQEQIEQLKRQLEDQSRIVDITEAYQTKLKEQLREVDERLNECDSMRREIAEMKTAYDKAIFNGRWNILRHFL